MRPLKPAGFVILSALAAAGCDPKPAATPPAKAAPIPPAEVTILYTTDEHGWALPFNDDGKSWGGAAEALVQFQRDEGHCVRGRVFGDTVTTTVPCKDEKTLLLSGGDNWTGPALSSFFAGDPMATAMSMLGYAASAFGNHELDFGRDKFIQHRESTKIAYLSANLKVDGSAESAALRLPAYEIFERRGARIGVVGLSPDTTLVEAMASRFKGVTFEKEETALVSAFRDAWAAKPPPDVMILIAHECPDKLAPILEKHPEFRLSLAFGGHCHKVLDVTAGKVRIIAPGWRLQRYARAAMTIDITRGEQEEAKDPLLKMDVSMVPIGGKDLAERPADAALKAVLTTYKSKLDAELGEKIGYTATGLEKDSDALARWISTSFQDEFKANTGLVNKHGLRQGLPAGPITKASVYSILPFDNKIVVATVTGKQLVEAYENPDAKMSSLTKKADALFLGPEKVDPAKKYSIATVDFLYLGGDHFKLQEQDPSPKEPGVDWREPVVNWTRRLATSERDPLENHLK
jgi:2',3'-cyclic-nucleotide 2'-phosphodiesterase (5'-nucleotidase family)